MGMICPRCGVPLDELTKAGVAADICGTCRGMWLDRGELKEIVTRVVAPQDKWSRAGQCAERAAAFETRTERPTAWMGEEALLRCPRCDDLLRETWRDGARVDVCGRCCGVWLDDGELGRITAYLRDFRKDWERDERDPGELIRWGRLPRYPRRHPRRRLGRLGIYS